MALILNQMSLGAYRAHDKIDKLGNKPLADEQMLEF